MKHIGRIRVIQEANDIMDCVCVCPHCNNHITYGEMMMTSGIHNCPKCNAEVNRQIELDKKADYDVYVRKANGHEYEPYRYIEKENESNV